MPQPHLFCRLLPLTLLSALAGLAAAQPTTMIDPADPGGGWQDWLPATIGGVLVLAAAGLGVFIFFHLRRRPADWEGDYSEPELVGSKFEQLLAEIQGLGLRVRGGESKGYYRKIEQLVRVYLERTGHVGARRMNDEEIAATLSKSALPQDQVQELKSIYEKCREGATRESERTLDFSAAELLQQLRGLIQRNDKKPARP